MEIRLTDCLRDTVPVFYELHGKRSVKFSMYKRPGDRIVELPEGAKPIDISMSEWIRFGSEGPPKP